MTASGDRAAEPTHEGRPSGTPDGGTASGGKPGAKAPAPWPAGGLEAVGTCPACGSSRRHVLYAGLTDRLFGAPGEWTMVRCNG